MIDRVSIKGSETSMLKIYSGNEFLGLGKMDNDKKEISVLKVLNKVENGNI